MIINKRLNRLEKMVALIGNTASKKVLCPTQERANKACTGQVGFVATFRHFSGFRFFLFPSIVHARPPASNANRSRLRKH